jgi:hypothetical protein
MISTPLLQQSGPGVPSPLDDLGVELACSASLLHTRDREAMHGLDALHWSVYLYVRTPSFASMETGGRMLQWGPLPARRDTEHTPGARLAFYDSRFASDDGP